MMDWPMSFCIIGSLWAIAFMFSRFTDFKKYHIDVLVKAVQELEADVQKIKEKT